MITPNDTAILYSPYTWDVTAARAKTINAGAYFRVVIVGAPASVVLNFDMAGVASPVPKITWEIDGWGRQTADLAATVTIPLPAENTWGKHLLTVTVEATSETVNRWTLQETAVKLTGIDTTGTAVAPAARPRKALVLGDSITEGVRTLNMNAATDTARNSSRNTWSYQIGPALDAEVGVVGFGATGFSRGGSGGAPAIISFWDTQWSGGPTRGVAGNQPDYIVINMGTNDPDTTDVTSLGVTLLNAMLAATTSTHIFVLTPFKSKHAAELAAMVAGSSNPARCTHVDTAGWWATVDASDGVHPYGYTAPALSRQLTTAISAVADAAPPAPDVNGYFFDANLVAVPMSLGIG